MDVVTRHDVAALIAERGDSLLSLFMPTHRKGRDIRQDPIRLRNLLDAAADKLAQRGLRTPHVREQLAPARDLLEDPEFWRFQADGLALFLRAGFIRTYRVPVSLDELVMVGDRFHLKPLFPLLADDGWFFIIAASLNGARLLHGTRDLVTELHVPDMPDGFDDLMQYVDTEKQLQFHTRAGGREGIREAMFHGTAAAKDDVKVRIVEYFRLVDRALHGALRGQRAPLVFAGVDSFFPLYREANHYPHLLDESVQGNTDLATNDELHAKAWAIVQPHFARERERAASLYQEAISKQRGSFDIAEVMPAAYRGRVDTLFVANGSHIWGSFTLGSQTVQLHPNGEAGGEDLLDAATVYTFAHGGRVFVVPAEHMPEDDAPLAAVYRF